MCVYLDSSFGEFGALGKFFASVDVRVLGPVESFLQFVHLLGSEGGPMAALLAL